MTDMLIEKASGIVWYVLKKEQRKVVTSGKDVFGVLTGYGKLLQCHVYQN